MLNFCSEIYVQEFQLKIGNNVCVVIYGTKRSSLYRDSRIAYFGFYPVELHSKFKICN